MDIKVLGPGCARCFELERKTLRAVDELGIAANVEKISDIQKIVAYRIMATPGLVIEGQVKCTGRIPSVDEIKTWIREAEGTKT
ncbi:MAG: thioredoxin family protein [Candidatus Aminicenantales bacterium]